MIFESFGGGRFGGEDHAVADVAYGAIDPFFV